MSATLHINKQNKAAGKTTNHENKDVKGQRKSPSTGMSWWSYAHFETTNVPKEATVSGLSWKARHGTSLSVFKALQEWNPNK